MDAEGDGFRAGMTTLGLILTNSSSIKEWNRIEHHRVSTAHFMQYIRTYRFFTAKFFEQFQKKLYIFAIKRYIKCKHKCKLIIQFTNFHYKYSHMDHSSSSFYSILIEPLKLIPAAIEIDDIRNPQFISNSSDISEPSRNRIDCDWEGGFCKDWSSSYLIPVENQKSKNCFRLGTI